MAAPSVGPVGKKQGPAIVCTTEPQREENMGAHLEDNPAPQQTLHKDQQESLFPRAHPPWPRCLFIPLAGATSISIHTDQPSTLSWRRLALAPVFSRVFHMSCVRHVENADSEGPTSPTVAQSSDSHRFPSIRSFLHSLSYLFIK